MTVWATSLWAATGAPFCRRLPLRTNCWSQMPNKRYLVSGGTGFVGSALVSRLVRTGYAVRVFDDDSRGSSGRLAQLRGDIEILHGDIRDKTAVAAATRGVDSVVHLAYVNGTEFFYSKPDL